MYPAGVAGISTRFVEIGPGLRLRVLEAGDPAGDAVLLVHGWAACAYSFAETIPALAAAGMRVIACDLPGFGLSDKPLDDARYTTPALCEALLALADRLDVRRFDFIGHSLGGSLGLRFAVDGEPRLRRLVLISAVGLASSPVIPPLRWLSPRFVNRFAPALVTRPLVSLILRTAYGSAGRPTSRDVDEYWAPSQFPEYAAACRASVHCTDWRRQPSHALRRIRIPVLVVTGGRDWLVHGAAARARLVPSCRVVRLPQGGHLAHQECAERANSELVAFLRVERAGAPGPDDY